MSGKPRASASEFLQAAQSVDNELAQFERAVEALRHLALDSAKGLERAGHSLGQVTQIEQRLSEAMQALSRTLTEAHARQQAQAQLAGERAQAIAVRTAELQKLMEGYQALGAAASSLNSEAIELVARKKALGDRPDAELTGDIAALQEKLSQVAQIAQQLLDACRTSGFEDVAQKVDSVRQQLLAAHNKLSLFVRSLVT